MPQENIISPAYKDVSINTAIAHLPYIINENNAHSTALFNNICSYTDSSQYIKLPVITKSLIKGGTGQFNNLIITGNITLDSSLINNESFLNIVVDHQKSNNRFSNDYKSLLRDKNWTHDAYSIYHKETSSLGESFDILKDTFDKILGEDYMTKDELLSYLTTKVDVSTFNDYKNTIDSSLKDIDSSITLLVNELSNIYKKLNINNSEVPEYTANDDEIVETPEDPMMFMLRRNVNNIDINETTVNNFVEVYNSVSTYYTYPINLYTEIPKYSSKYYKSKSDYNDIKNGIRFKYYNVNNNKYIKIDNEYPVVINGNIGDEIDLIIEQKLEKDINIKLSSNKNSYSYVRVLKDDIPLARITLVCVDYNDVYGCSWYVKNYSGNIQLK